MVLKGIVGGSLIGGSASVLLLTNGDIMGISGIMNNSILQWKNSLRESQYHWRWVFIASFCSAAHLYAFYLIPEAIQDERIRDSDVPIPSSMAHLLGGLLVGMGTRIGNGCTTGHGICGIGRFSLRSLTATCLFTGMSILTRFVVSPLRSWSNATMFLRVDTAPSVSPLLSFLVVVGTTAMAILSPTTVQSESHLKKKLGALISGAMFAGGLALSGMVQISKVHDFLCLSGIGNKTFDPTLMAVMGSGILSSWLGYQFVSGRSHTRPAEKCLACPLNADKNGWSSIPTNTSIDKQLASGTILFGLGWGLTGICPGPALFAAATGNVNAAAVWIPGFCVGSYVANQMKQKSNANEKKTK